MGILEVVFVVCILLAIFAAGPWAEPYRAYAGWPLVIAVVVLGMRVFALHA